MTPLSRPHLVSAVLAVLLTTLSGCSNSHGQPDQSSATRIDPAPAMAAPMSLRAQVDFARRDLAERLSVEVDEVELSGARPVNWRSSALGCPEPGMQYTDALVPGALIFLRKGSDIHGYHAKHGEKPFYCPRERAEQPVFGQGADQI